MEETIVGWAQSQSWFGIACTVVALANTITMTLTDQYAEKIPFIGKIWTVLNWLSLNVFHNKNEKK